MLFRSGYGPLSPGHVLVPYGDIKALEAQMDDDVCAVLLEPIQGEGGVRPASQEFLQGLRDLCDEKGILLMFDEVQVGSGRTGKLFAHQNYGVEPDTCSMAKALGSGVPIGAVCARGEAAKTLTPGTHGSTFAGGPLACALAATTLDVMINEGVIENARVMGEYFRDQMHKVIEKNHPKAVNEIRGLGMINGIQLNHPSGQPVVDLCYKDANVLINNTNGNVLRFVPPLIVNEEEIDIAVFHAKLLAGALFYGLQELVCKLVALYICYFCGGVVFADVLTDGEQQVRFAETGVAVDEERVIGLAGVFRNGYRGGVGEFI